jgi:hypothetical protein
LKVFFYDLSETSNIYIVAFLLIIGVATLIIARIDSYWRKKHEMERSNNVKEITVVGDVE